MAARHWNSGAMLGRATLAGLLLGGTSGAATVVGAQLFWLTPGISWWNVLAGTFVYGSLGFMVGAVVGMLEAWAAVGPVLLVVRGGDLGWARAVGAAGTVAVPALLAACTYPVSIVVGVWALAALAASLTMPWVAGSRP